MSHFSRQKAPVTDVECTVIALNALGFKATAVKTGTVAVRDYTGEPTDQRANVIVKRETMGDRCADLGYYVDPTGKESQSFADPYQCDAISKLGGVNKLTAKVAQEYGVAVLCKQAKAKGKVAQRVEGKDGRAYVFVNA